MADYNEILLRFFRDDIGGILITDVSGAILYSDSRSDFIRNEKTNWASACPSPRAEQKAEAWDLIRVSGRKTYMVVTSTVQEQDSLIQIHHLVDSSLFMEMYRSITDYSKTLKQAGDHDAMTGLFNKGKFMALKESLFRGQDAIAIWNMDVNNLKHMNDTLGHDVGDMLIRKAADSLKRIEARNVMPFRIGGDEFLVVAIHMDREKAEQISQKWEEALAELNRKNDGVFCDIACGFVFGEKGYDLDELLAQADRLMYENKKAKKASAALQAPPV